MTLCSSATVLAGAAMTVYLTLGATAGAQTMGDGEACLAGSGRALLDEAYCRRALSRPDLAPAEQAALLTSQASALLGLGETAAAAAVLEHALSLNPNSARAYLLRGLVRRGQGSALADLNRAVALNPFYVEALAYRGAAHFQAGDRIAALADFDRALEIRPRSSQALFFKGVLRFQQGRWTAAASLFRRVSALAPVQHPIAALWLAAAVSRQGKDAGEALKPYLWWWEDGVWPTAMVGLWAGKVPPDQVVTAIAELAGDVRAQGAFFLGQWYLAKGDEKSGQHWLQQVRRHPKPYLPEVIVAGGPAGN